MCLTQYKNNDIYKASMRKHEIFNITNYVNYLVQESADYLLI